MRVVSVVVAVALAAPAPAMAAATPDPAAVGRWTAPFEEGGASQPRCSADPAGPHGQLVCKPVAVAAGVLPDGRVWYSDGLTGSESWGPSSAGLGNRTRNAATRVLDLTGGRPAWSVPTPTDGGGPNPAIDPGSGFGDDPAGTLGAPGEPGGGLVGSLWGAAGGPPSAPSDPPDDPEANDYDLFCGDLAQLPDGRVLLAGGTDWYNQPDLLSVDRGDPADLGFPEVEGIRTSRLFDGASDTYAPTGHMKFGRWYPTVVTLPDGHVSVFGGVTKVTRNTQLSQVRRVETFDSASGSWTENYTGPASESSLPLVARLALMPNGKILFTGSGQMWTPAGQAVDEASWALQRFWDPRTQVWETVGLSPWGVRGGAPQVLLAMDPPYDSATVMDVGGTIGLPTPGTYLGTALATLTTVTADGAISNARTGDLHNPRWFSSALTLPTGEVLAVSGSDRDATLTSGSERAVRQAELYDPETGQWTAMAEAGRDRTYHNSAVLLPDGRVLVGGHAPFPAGFPPFTGTHRDVLPGVTASNQRDPSFEVFSPPYLFRGPRPAIARVQQGLRWDQPFRISTPDAGSITEVVLSRLPSPQHVTDPDARTLRLPFSVTGRGLTAIAPPASGPGESVVAPPGYYYLFIVKRTPAGPVPSVARIVKLGPASDPTPTRPIYASDEPPPPDTGADETAATPDPPAQEPMLPNRTLGSVATGRVGGRARRGRQRRPGAGGHRTRSPRERPARASHHRSPRSAPPRARPVAPTERVARVQR